MTRYNIDTCALLVELTTSAWTARKLDKNVSDEVINNKGAQAKGAARVNKHLLAGRNELDIVTAHVTSAREYVYHNTLPWSDSGLRLLPTSRFVEFNDHMGKLEEQFTTLVNDFITVYPTLITAQAMALGDMFNRSEYPHPNDIARKFSFRVNYMPVPKAGDFRVDVGNDAQKELQDKLSKLADERVEAALKDARDRLKGHLDRMMERLRVETVNGKVVRGRIHDSLIEGGLELCEMLKSLNITNDLQLEAARVEVERVLKSVTPDDLRQHNDARTEVRTQVADILDRFNF
jgi:hypothetical protein